MQGHALLPGSRERRRGNGLRLGQEKLRVDFSFPKGVVQPWYSYPGQDWTPLPERVKKLCGCVELTTVLG